MVVGAVHRPVLKLVLLPSEPFRRVARPARAFQIGWARCSNASSEPLFIYGPHHPADPLALETSLYILAAGQSTPRGWDFKGFLIPAGRCGQAFLSGELVGPMAVKYWDLRQIEIGKRDARTYRCPFINRSFRPGEIIWPIPELRYEDLLALRRRSIEP